MRSLMQQFPSEVASSAEREREMHTSYVLWFYGEIRLRLGLLLWFSSSSSCFLLVLATPIVSLKPGHMCACDSLSPPSLLAEGRSSAAHGIASCLCEPPAEAPQAQRLPGPRRLHPATWVGRLSVFRGLDTLVDSPDSRHQIVEFEDQSTRRSAERSRAIPALPAHVSDALYGAGCGHLSLLQLPQSRVPQGRRLSVRSRDLPLLRTGGAQGAGVPGRTRLAVVAIIVVTGRAGSLHAHLLLAVVGGIDARSSVLPYQRPRDGKNRNALGNR